MKNQALPSILVVFLFALLISSLVFTAQGFSSFETAQLDKHLEVDDTNSDQNGTLERIVTYKESVKTCPEFKTIEFTNLLNDRESNTVSASILKISPACQKTGKDSTNHSVKAVAANKALNVVLENYKLRKIYANGAIDGNPMSYEFTVESFKTTIEPRPRSFQPAETITMPASPELSARSSSLRQGWGFFQRFRKSEVSI